MKQGRQSTSRPGEIQNTTRHADFLFKIILIGIQGVGKTAFSRRIQSDTFSSTSKSTIGVEFHCKSLRMHDGALIRLQIWDTSGQEKFRSLVSSYYRGAHGIIYMFALDNSKSLSSIDQLVQDVAHGHVAPNHIAAIVGNRKDLVTAREVTTHQGVDMAQKYECDYVETSVKDDPETTWAILYNMAQKLYAQRTKLGVDSYTASLLGDGTIKLKVASPNDNSDDNNDANNDPDIRAEGLDTPRRHAPLIQGGCCGGS